MFKKVGEMLVSKMYGHERHFIVSKNFEKLVNDKLAEYPENFDWRFLFQIDINL